MNEYVGKLKKLNTSLTDIAESARQELTEASKEKFIRSASIVVNIKDIFTKAYEKEMDVDTFLDKLGDAKKNDKIMKQVLAVATKKIENNTKVKIKEMEYRGTNTGVMTVDDFVYVYVVVEGTMDELLAVDKKLEAELITVTDDKNLKKYGAKAK